MIFVVASLSATGNVAAVDCLGDIKTGLGVQGMSRALDDGGLIAFAKMNINVDGSGKGYHRLNKGGGALIHLCNAGRVYLPSGESYNPAVSQYCTGRFMDDLTRIESAGWNDPSVGAIHWYGIVGEGRAEINHHAVIDVKPIKSASGFFVSPTTLFDPSITDRGDQKRYVDPLIVQAAVAPKSIASFAPMGSYGVAIDRKKGIAVPFIVGDVGPRIGEGSVALARAVAGLPKKTDIAYSERYAGAQDQPNVLWVFFGRRHGVGSYDSSDPEKSNAAAESAYKQWGGKSRLDACLVRAPRN